MQNIKEERMRPIKSWVVLLSSLLLAACTSLQSAPIQKMSPGINPTEENPTMTNLPANNPAQTSTAPVAAVAWENAEWTLESFGNADRPQPVSPGTQITVLFNNSNGTVSGSAGCNTYSGGYKLDGDRLSISPLAVTLMACEQPVMDQEAEYLKALQAVQSSRVQEGKLQITYGENQVMNFTGAQAQEPAFEDTLWQLEAYGDLAKLVQLLPDSQITATFTKVVGKVAGSAGCNNYSARYQLEGDKLSITAPASTKMACPQPIMDQESAYLKALENAQSFKVQAGELIISSADGEVLIFVPVG
jgi:heat shock protein HslJ